MPSRSQTLGSWQYRFAAGASAAPRLTNSTEAHSPLSSTFLFLASLTLIVVSLFQVIGSAHLTRGWQTQVTVLFIVWAASFVAACYAKQRHLYLFSIIYIACLGAFHLGITIPVGLGIRADPWEGDTLARWVEQAGWYTCLALGSFGVGYVFAARQARPSDPNDLNAGVAVRARLFRDGINVLAVCLVLMTATVAMHGNLLQYSRAEIFSGIGDTRTLGVLIMLLPVGACFVLIGAQTKPQLLFGFGLGAVVLLLGMLSGYRSHILVPALVGAAVWRNTGRRIPILLTTVGGPVLLLSIAAIGILRNEVGSYQSITSTNVASSFKGASVGASFNEMGQTAAVLAHVIRLVPTTDSYRYGSTYLKALRNAIPNIRTHISESQTDRMRSGAAGAIDKNDVNQLSPSNWLTYRIARERFYLGQGVGFSGIGEPYLNFGLPGVFVIYLAVGVLFARMDSSPLLKSGATLMVVLLLSIGLTFGSRNDSNALFKPMAFALISVYGMRIVTRPFQRSRAA